MSSATDLGVRPTSARTAPTSLSSQIICACTWTPALYRELPCLLETLLHDVNTYSCAPSDTAPRPSSSQPPTRWNSHPLRPRSPISSHSASVKAPPPRSVHAQLTRASHFPREYPACRRPISYSLLTPVLMANSSYFLLPHHATPRHPRPLLQRPSYQHCPQTIPRLVQAIHARSSPPGFRLPFHESPSAPIPHLYLITSQRFVAFHALDALCRNYSCLSTRVCAVSSAPHSALGMHRMFQTRPCAVRIAASHSACPLPLYPPLCRCGASHIPAHPVNTRFVTPPVRACAVQFILRTPPGCTCYSLNGHALNVRERCVVLSLLFCSPVA